MHPAMRAMKRRRQDIDVPSPKTPLLEYPNVETNESELGPIPAGGVGIASNPLSEKAAIRRGIEEEQKKGSAVYPKPNILRDGPPTSADLRHLQYHSGLETIVEQDAVQPEDFVNDMPGSSRGTRHVEAVMLKHRAESTVAQEKSFMTSFLNSTRDYLSRCETASGLYMLEDFINAFLNASDTGPLLAQLTLIRSHTTGGVLSRTFADLKNKGNMWCVDLIEMLDTIANDADLTLRQMVSAVNITVTRLGTYYAKKASGNEYPTSDQVMKSITFFCRAVTALLGLAQTLGCYSTGMVPRRPRAPLAGHVSAPREMSEREFMVNLQDALESSRDDVSFHPPSNGVGGVVQEEEEEGQEEYGAPPRYGDTYFEASTSEDPLRPHRVSNSWR